MKRHHVELACAPSDGAWYAYARCRCGWKGDRRTGPGAYTFIETQAQAHERAVREGLLPDEPRQEPP